MTTTRGRTAPRRKCPKCGQSKALNEGNWARRRDGADGWKTHCKACLRLAAQAKRDAEKPQAALDLLEAPKADDAVDDEVYQRVKAPFVAWRKHEAECGDDCPGHGALLNEAVEAFRYFFNRYSRLVLPAHGVVWARAALEHRSLLLNVPPDHAKTTIMGQWFVLWHVVCDRSTEALVVSQSSSIARRTSRNIARQLEYNRKLLGDWGRFKDPSGVRPWRREGELLVEPVGGEQDEEWAGDLTLQVRGARSALLGQRAHLIVADDVTDRSIAASEPQRKEEMAWFTGEVLTRLRPSAHVLCIGQRVHPFDLYGQLGDLEDDLTGYKVWKTVRTPAILNWQTREVLWPERWPWKTLMQQRAYDPANFECMYQQAPDASTVSAVARQIWVEGGELNGWTFPGCLDVDRSLGQPVLQSVNLSPGVRVLSIDPSGGTGYGAVVVADVVFGHGQSAADARIHIIDAMHEARLGYQDMLDLVRDVANQYRPGVVIFEENAWRSLSKDAAAKELARLTTAQVVAHSTHASKRDTEWGLFAMSRLFQGGLIRFPWKDEASQEMSRLVLDEALARTSTNDVLMSAWFIFNKLSALRAMVPGMLPVRFKPAATLKSLQVQARYAERHKALLKRWENRGRAFGQPSAGGGWRS